MKQLSKIYKELGIDFTFPIEIKNAKGKVTYQENSSGFWSRQAYDVNGWEEYYENSRKEWAKEKYDANGRELYFEDSNGVKRVNPKTPKEPKTCEGKVIELDGVKYALKKL